MISVKNCAINKKDQDLIQSSLYINSHKSLVKLPLIIFAHGFKGFKDWGGFPYLCIKLAEEGFAVLSFNFSHNGIGISSPVDFTKLDKFADNTHSIELNDIASVIDSTSEFADEFNIDINKIGLLGHSRGGGVSIITASEDKRIKALVTLASIAKFDRYTDEQKKRWREKGYIEIPNTRTNQMMRMNIGLLNDIENNTARFDILKAASGLNKQYMIIHGKEDLAVKFTDAESIYSASDPSVTELKIIENTGHTFGVEHPFKGSTKAFDEVIGLTAGFFRKYLL
jgi:dipeptidyl aminopeptidase/acylaminoacyl peptidase